MISLTIQLMPDEMSLFSCAKLYNVVTLENTECKINQIDANLLLSQSFLSKLCSLGYHSFTATKDIKIYRIFYFFMPSAYI